MKYQYQKIKSPVGNLYVAAQGEAICAIIFQERWDAWSRGIEAEEVESPVLERAKRQLVEYFQGKRRSFDLPLHLNGTDFQKRVWTSLANIPFGQTRTYKEQAAAVEAPGASRAVGRTNGLNPLCIVLPCHRIIGSDGALTGYAGGLEAKKFLLDLEGGAGIE